MIINLYLVLINHLSKQKNSEYSRLNAAYLRSSDLFDVTEQSGASQGPVLRVLACLQSHVGDVGQVSTLRLLVDWTFVHLEKFQGHQTMFTGHTITQCHCNHNSNKTLTSSSTISNKSC